MTIDPLRGLWISASAARIPMEGSLLSRGIGGTSEERTWQSILTDHQASLFNRLSPRFKTRPRRTFPRTESTICGRRNAIPKERTHSSEGRPDERVKRQQCSCQLPDNPPRPVSGDTGTALPAGSRSPRQTVRRKESLAVLTTHKEEHQRIRIPSTEVPKTLFRWH